MSIWLVCLIGGLMTFAMRLSFIYLFVRLEVPEAVRRALRFVPPAVFSAIIVPALVMPAGTMDFSLRNYRLLAGLLAMIVAWRTRTALLTVVVGMAVLLLLELTLNPSMP